MKVVKRWGVMTLAALLVLGTMGAALASDDVETEEAKEALEPGSYQVALDWAGDLVGFVFYWGSRADPEAAAVDVEVETFECESPEPVPGGSIFFPADDPADDLVDCFPLEIKKPNHGSLVSAFVHWLKGDDGQLLLAAGEFSGKPKGQLVKEFAHDDFGKGFFGFDDSLTEVSAEDDDGDGPPAWVLDKKAEKAETRGKKK